MCMKEMSFEVASLQKYQSLSYATIHACPTFRVLERIGYKHLIAHLRTLCELLIFELSKSGGAGFVTKAIESINNLVWKYNIIALDRFILCMVLRTTTMDSMEGSEAQVRAVSAIYNLYLIHKIAQIL